MGDVESGLIKQMLTKLHEVDTTLEAYHPGSQQLLADHLQEFSGLLAQFQQLVAARPDTNIPVELLRFVDAGRTSDDYVRHLFQVANADNQLVKGRLGALSELRNKLLQEAGSCFPGDAQVYRDVAAEKAAVAPAHIPGEGLSTLHTDQLQPPPGPTGS